MKCPQTTKWLARPLITMLSTISVSPNTRSFGARASTNNSSMSMSPACSSTPSNAAFMLSKSSTSVVSRLPVPTCGFNTTGNGSSDARASIVPASPADTGQKRGPGTPAAASAKR